jgi:hypothetical protein
MKYCICFFGVVSRSIEYTINSINNNILQVLKENNIEYDIFIHNNRTNILTNVRSYEYNCKIQNDKWRLLNPTEFIEDDQSDFDKNYNWKPLFQCGDIHDDNYSSVKNAIRELYSIKRVTSLWENKDPYDLYLYLRPDLLYINKLTIPPILKNNTLYTPSWHKWTGLNDRIYFAKYDTMLKIAKRIDYMEELILNTKIPYNAETYMKQVVDKFNIQTIDINLEGERVRANGIQYKN